jgi:hypothetical protein
VGCGEATRDLSSIVDGEARGERPVVHGMAKRLPLQEFGNNIRTAFVFTDLVDGENIRVVECGGALRFLSKTPKAVGIA